MNDQIRRQIVREFPELAAGYHLPVMAEVIEVPDAPINGGINDSYRPRYAVTVELLTTHYEKTGMIYTSVPVAQMGGGAGRGVFALPPKNTIVELAWLNGSPERPFVRSILGDRQSLPYIDCETMSWQQNEESYQTVDASGNWSRHTTTSISDKADTYQLQAAEAIVQLGNEVKRILEHSVEDIDGKKQIEATAIHLLSSTVLNLLAAGSVNIAAAEYSTRSATKGIKDNSSASIEMEAAENIELKATADASITADKIHIGNETDNLLTLLSETMQLLSDVANACAAITIPLAPSGVGAPLNAAAFSALTPQISAIKSKLAAFTK